ncbi:MAG: manganese transport system permease protein, partial [Chloroflexota bacterium]|nr:manganese transport system permease protein [Chloroflexota bacterium]
ALTVLLVSGLQRRADVGHAGAVGVVFMTLFALGVVLVGLLKVRSPDVGASLVGNVLGVATGDLLLSLGLVLTLGLVLSLLYWPLVLTCFDRTSAALTLPVAILDLVLLTMVAGTAVVSLRVVGVILTVAVLVIPAATALRWTRRLPRAMLIAGVVSALAGMASLYVTYYARIAPAAVMVLVLAGVFLGSTLLGPYGVVIPRRWLAADVPAMRARDERTV